MGIEAKDRRARIGFGGANLAVAVFVVVGVFRFLPARWWLVDTGAVVVGLLLGASGIALLAKAPIAEPLTRIASGLVLVIGLALFTAIVTTAGWIGGVYGQVGTSGAIIFGLVAALVLPYVVVLPAVELAWIGPRLKTDASSGSKKAVRASKVTREREDGDESNEASDKDEDEERKEAAG